MAKHSPEQIAADAANAKAGKCPECLEPLSKPSALAHAADHWGDGAAIQQGSDAERRLGLIKQFAAA